MGRSNNANARGYPEWVVHSKLLALALFRTCEKVGCGLARNVAEELVASMKPQLRMSI